MVHLCQFRRLIYYLLSYLTAWSFSWFSLKTRQADTGWYAGQFITCQFPSLVNLPPLVWLPVDNNHNESHSERTKQTQALSPLDNIKLLLISWKQSLTVTNSKSTTQLAHSVSLKGFNLRFTLSLSVVYSVQCNVSINMGHTIVAYLIHKLHVHSTVYILHI